MKRLKITIQFIIFLLILLICTKIKAASITLSPNRSTVEEGEEFTISINLSGASLASLNTKIAVDTSKVEYISSTEPNNTNFNNGKILYTWTDASGGANPKTNGTLVTFTLKAKNAGTANFTISGNFYDSEENSVSLTLTGTSVNINGNTPEIQPPPATENNNVEENNGEDNGENTEPPEENNNQEETQPPQNEENNNENQNEPQQQPQQENNNLSSNAYLASLQVSIEGISPRFNKNTTNYYLIIDNTIDTINVNATPEDANASVLVTGNTNLQIGVNKITITVTAQNGSTKRNYIINVTKTDDPNNANNNLENLAIEDAILSPEFSRDVLEYTTSVGSNVENINILAIPEIEGAIVNITGGNNLKFGNNIVTITVTAKDNVSSKIYTINVYKKTETEEIEEQMALLEENNNLRNNIDNNTISFQDTNNTKKSNIVLWVIFIILFNAVILIVLYIISNKRKKDNYGK